MARNFGLLSFILLSLLGFANARAAEPAKNDAPVKASLIADISNIRANRPFTIGVLLEIEPGWHVYWTNPGDSGTQPSSSSRRGGICRDA